LIRIHDHTPLLILTSLIGGLRQRGQTRPDDDQFPHACATMEWFRRALTSAIAASTSHDSTEGLVKSRENEHASQRRQTPYVTASGLTVADVFDILSPRHEHRLDRSITTCGRNLMKVVRIYTGADNQTHFQDLDADTFATLAAKVGEGAVRLNQGPAKSFSDFHNAPRRQYVVIMSGMMEIEIADGVKRQLGPGDVLVAEDLTGKGHITRGIGEEPRISLAVPLASE
jgi:hypothetical protein